ncbi:MAG: YaeQ family protein [Myxococcales bacterium]|nr:YaeQ family protein [Myxococcales bacterium]
MALPATVRTFHIALSDVDRAVYETLDLRVAQHPSETAERLIARVLAYCVCFEEGVAFSGAGLCAPDEPAVSVRDALGGLAHWIEVGLPSAERVHKAAKAAARVSVFAHRDPAPLFREAERRRVHGADRVRVYALDPVAVATLAGVCDRKNDWTVIVQAGTLTVSTAETTVTCALEPVPLDRG